MKNGWVGEGGRTDAGMDEGGDGWMDGWMDGGTNQPMDINLTVPLFRGYFFNQPSEPSMFLFH